MSDTTALTVLKLLANGRGVQFVAAFADLTPKDVLDLVGLHGAARPDGSVDEALLPAAIDRLEQAAEPKLRHRVHAEEPPAPAPKPPLVAAGPDVVLAQVPLDRLKVDPANPRENIGAVAELAASMREVGLLQPIVARRTAGGQLYVVAGHRRLRAARSLGWRSVPVVIRRDMRSDEVLAAMLIENGQRKDLDFIEEARGLARLKGLHGCTDTDLARRIGRTTSHVTRRLHLLALPADEQAALRDGEMSLKEATYKARLTSGRLPSNTPRGVSHLSPAHPLAQAAKARCLRLAHGRGRGQGVGGIACGSCWESVIRADERSHLHERSGATGKCALCDTPIPITREATVG